MRDCRPVTPPSKAVRRARKQLSPKAQTPRFDPAVHRSPVKAMEALLKDKDDSFVAVIESRSPAKITQAEPNDDMTHEPDGADLNAAPVASATRPSAQRSPRIEDSVEELDALEEAIDKIGESLPAMMDEPESQVVPAKGTNASPRDASPQSLKEMPATDETTVEPPVVEVEKRATRGKPATAASENKKRQPSAKAPRAAQTTRPLKAPSTAKAASSRIAPKEVASRPVANETSTQPSLKTAASRAAARPGAGAIKAKAAEKTASATKHTSPAPARPGPTSKPTTKATSPTISKAAPKPAPASAVRPRPRVSSVSKAPFVPAKSNKAPTVSTFSLPGDAISARLKTQREERLKREDEAVQRKRDFKARPVRHSSAGSGPKAADSVRSTATSRARLSVAKGEAPTAGGEKVRGQVAQPGPLPAAKVAKKPAAPNATAQARTASTPTQPRMANMKAVRSPPSASKAATTTTVPKVRAKTPAIKAPPAKTEMQIRREKEEAAKKARDEAAERGRAASRVWAEKMKQKGAKRVTSGTTTTQEPSLKVDTSKADTKRPSTTAASLEEQTDSVGQVSA